MTREDFNTLEDFVDRYGIRDVLGNLGTIAGEKSDHIAASYDDRPLAHMWENVQRVCERAAEAVAVRTLARIEGR